MSVEWLKYITESTRFRISLQILAEHQMSPAVSLYAIIDTNKLQCTGVHCSLFVSMRACLDIRYHRVCSNWMFQLRIYQTTYNPNDAELGWLEK